MDTKELYREILNEHNINPTHKAAMDAPDFCLEGVNPSCGDQITLQLKLGDDGKISDASFTGSGCAISQASVDMMADLVIGKTKEEALALADIFDRMIKSEVTDLLGAPIDVCDNCADVETDGEINIADVTALIDMLLTRN